MTSSKLARAYDDNFGRNWRATKNRKHRERTRWMRENFGSDQRIAKARKRRAR
jgi:hypothetical protein